MAQLLVVRHHMKLILQSWPVQLVLGGCQIFTGLWLMGMFEQPVGGVWLVWRIAGALIMIAAIFNLIQTFKKKDA